MNATTTDSPTANRTPSEEGRSSGKTAPLTRKPRRRVLAGATVPFDTVDASRIPVVTPDSTRADTLANTTNPCVRLSIDRANQQYYLRLRVDHSFMGARYFGTTPYFAPSGSGGWNIGTGFVNRLY